MIDADIGEAGGLAIVVEVPDGDTGHPGDALETRAFGDVGASPKPFFRRVPRRRGIPKPHPDTVQSTRPETSGHPQTAL